MIWTIRLTTTNVDETETLLTIDDERCRTGDIKTGDAKPMIDPIALDHRAVRVDEEWDSETMRGAVLGHFGGTLADDHQDLSTQSLIR